MQMLSRRCASLPQFLFALVQYLHWKQAAARLMDNDESHMFYTVMSRKETHHSLSIG